MSKIKFTVLVPVEVEYFIPELGTVIAPPHSVVEKYVSITQISKYGHYVGAIAQLGDYYFCQKTISRKSD